MRYEETDTVELKREMVDDLDKEIIALLNTNGGKIYIGVDNDGSVVGVPDELKDEYDLKVSSIITHNIEPNCRELVSFSYNKDNVLEIKIKKGNHRPYYLAAKGPRPAGTYLRIGRSSRQAKPEEIIHLIMDDKGYSFEKDVSPNQNLTFNYMFNASKDTGLKFSKEKFRVLQLINEDGLFTNLALWISDQNPIVVKLAVYDTNMDFIVKELFSGSIVSIADRLLKNAELYNFTSAKIVPGKTERIENKCYPGVSLREAIINAICHADYTMPSNIKIEFFINKVKIVSPGDVYNATLEAVLKGTQTYRNIGLVNIFYRLDYIENFGSGIPRIREAYKKQFIKPKFKVIDRYFFVELNNTNRSLDNFFKPRIILKPQNGKNHVTHDPVNLSFDNTIERDLNVTHESKTARLYRENSNIAYDTDFGENVTQGSKNVTHDVTHDVTHESFLSDINKILLAIKNNNKISKKDLSIIIGKDSRTVRRIIKAYGKIFYVGHPKSGHWVIEDE